MDSTLWVIVAALALIVIWALIMGKRFLRGSFRFGKGVSAEHEDACGRRRAALSRVWGQ
jgi:hypothetical protein